MEGVGSARAKAQDQREPRVALEVSRGNVGCLDLVPRAWKMPLQSGSLPFMCPLGSLEPAWLPMGPWNEVISLALETSRIPIYTSPDSNPHIFSISHLSFHF